MSDSILLSSEDVRRIDRVCREYDPASDREFCEFLALIPNPDDRQFFLDYHRGEIRAYVEMGLVMKKAARFVRDYAEPRGRACIEALTTLVGSPPDPGWFDWAEESFRRNRLTDPNEIRRWQLWQELEVSSPAPLFTDQLSNAFGTYELSARPSPAGPAARISPSQPDKGSGGSRRRSLFFDLESTRCFGAGGYGCNGFRNPSTN